MIDYISSLPPEYVYFFVFIGICCVGGFVLLPAIYLSLLGVLNIVPLYFITVFAGIVADSLWYAIGTVYKKDKLYRFSFLRKRAKETELFSEYYVKRGVLFSFITKFIYGTRIASHLLAGMHRIPYIPFLFATTLGTSIWFFIFVFLIKSLDVGIDSVKATAFKIELLCLLLAIIVISLNIFTGKYLRKKLIKRGKI